MSKLTTMTYTLSLTIEDTSYFSLVRAFEEALDKMKSNEDEIQFGKSFEFTDEYSDGTDNGKYILSISSS